MYGIQSVTLLIDILLSFLLIVVTMGVNYERVTNYIHEKTEIDYDCEYGRTFIDL